MVTSYICREVRKFMRSNQNDIYRETWSPDRRFLIRAYARNSVETNVKNVFRTVGVVQVFEGDPKLSGMPEIFLSSSKLNGNDLLDELQNAEWLGRDFVAKIKR